MASAGALGGNAISPSPVGRSGENPPDGAVIDYQLPSNVRTVSLEILDSTGALVRRFSSDDPRERMLDSTNVPSYWIRPEQRVETAAGMHRFVWDLHYPYPKNVELSYPISAVPFNTVKEPRGPWVLPGRYTVRLVADGRAAMTAPLTVRMDPRITTPKTGLVQQFTLSMQLYNEINRDAKRAAELVPLYTMLQETDAAPSIQLVAAVRRLMRQHRPSSEQPRRARDDGGYARSPERSPSVSREKDPTRAAGSARTARRRRRPAGAAVRCPG